MRNLISKTDKSLVATQSACAGASEQFFLRVEDPASCVNATSRRSDLSIKQAAILSALYEATVGVKEFKRGKKL